MAKAARVTFIPNDTSHTELTREEAPKKPPAGSATVWVRPKFPPSPADPGTAPFRYWQTEEALVSGLVNWKGVAGRALAGWQGARKTLPVVLDAGEDLNANYDRASLNFYHYDLPGRRLNTSESPDVACHEQGHALLDALRPDFWGAPFAEVAAFHESWGDCMAMLVTLGDPVVCAQALKTGLDRDNLVSNLAEDLANAIGVDLGHPEMVDGVGENAALRKALNDWRYTPPDRLPFMTPAGQLAAEPHNFSRVFTGCFYDVIRFLFDSGGRKSAAKLGEVAALAGELLVAAVQTVPVTPGLYHAVAERFLQADAQLFGGVHASEIRAAFGRHGITLGAPRLSLKIPVLADRPAVSRAAATGRLEAMLNLPADSLQFLPVRSRMHGEMAHVAGFALEDVSDAHPALAGVSAHVPAGARVQLSGASITGVIGEPVALGEGTRRAAKHFVRTLVETGNLETDAGLNAAALPAARRPGPPTHAVRVVDGKRVVVRTRFA